MYTTPLFHNIQGEVVRDQQCNTGIPGGMQSIGKVECGNG